MNNTSLLHLEKKQVILRYKFLKSMIKHKLQYICIKALFFPCKYLPYKALHSLGKVIGLILYHLHTSYRKRALSNLSLAKSLALSEKELIATAKASFQNLAINTLEYAKLACDPALKNLIKCENPEEAQRLIETKQGVVFFCGHQSNWEVLFLDGTQRMPGVAIGRPIKNPLLYEWVVSIRQRFGGKIIEPKQAIKEGFKALKRGLFLGIVGDQGMPDSGFSSCFLGREAFTSPAPALLAYRSNSPLIVATTRRREGKYLIHYSSPLWPDLTKPLEQEVPRLMQEALAIFEKSIVASPGEWLWQHNRWKQETPKTLYYKYRYDALLIVMPEEGFGDLVNHLATFREIYPKAFITIAVPKSCSIFLPPIEADIWLYSDIKELYKKNYSFKLLFNFSHEKGLDAHYKKLSVFKSLHIKDLKKAASAHTSDANSLSFSDLLKRALCRPGTLWSP